MLDTKEFICKANNIHDSFYSYEKTIYEYALEKVIITCPNHGDFFQKPNDHLNNHGCPECGGTKQLNTAQFIERAKTIHGDVYSYENSVYKNALTKIIITCSKHGDFLQIPHSHLDGKGCMLCSGKQKKTTEDFVKDASKIHGSSYSYEKVNYKGIFTKVIITCPKHGDFFQKPNDHLNNHGCASCGGTKLMTLKEFIGKSNEIHHNKYQYKDYVRNGIKVTIICLKHGEFQQTPNSHLAGRGCYKCALEELSIRKTDTLESFIEKANKVHGQYSYENATYVDSGTKLEIICAKHGSFMQTPQGHSRGQGCPICKSSKGEKKISEYLNDLSVTFRPQYKIKECKNIKSLPFDFAIFKENILLGLIEYQGKQHFNMGWTHARSAAKKFKALQESDNIKKEYCKHNNIPLLEIPYTEFNNIPHLLQEFINTVYETN